MLQFTEKIQRFYRWRKRKAKVLCGFSIPVIIYQMGKVGSMSLYWGLEPNAAIDLFHVHRMNPNHIKAVRIDHSKRGYHIRDDHRLGLFLYQRIISPKKPVKIITLVREPIGRNISAYFQNLDSFYSINNAHSKINIDNLIEDFIANYSHDTPLNWFDNEIFATTGIDVFKHTFPKGKGYLSIKEPPCDLLIIRHDLDDRIKKEVIKQFLCIDQFELIRKNVGANKKYSIQYHDFINKIKLPSEYLDKMLNSKYARHFYSKEELHVIRKKWLNNG